MKRTRLLSALISLGLLILIPSMASATVYYVDKYATGTGDGSSWVNAFNHPQDAMDAVRPGDEVWVAQGTYKRRAPSDTVVLNMVDGVGVYGGFDGTETDLSQRDYVNKLTVFDGEDVAEHVVVGANNARLDGFTVTGGSPYTVCCVSKGGGMYNDHVSPVVANCTFTQNNSHLGGGMYNYYSSPVVENCTFEENRAQDSGGGMFNQAGSPTVSDSTFSYNRAQWEGWGAGGGMYNTSSSPSVDNCTFHTNIAKHDGGGMHNWNSSPTVTDCIFNNNISNAGGAIHNEDASPAINNCTFTANSVSQGTQIVCDPFGCYPVPYGGHGGAIYNNAASPTITDCFLNTNSAANSGGGMYSQGESLFVTNCTFTENSAVYGGGMHSYNSAPSFTRCSFIENSAGQGGGIFIDGAVSGLITPSVTNCTFAENRADGSGGAMTIENSRPTITDCIFSENSANSKGGGIHNYITTSAVYVPSITNCIFSGNSSSYGGGAYTSEHCPQITMNLNVTNCTFTGNRADQQGGGICNGECGSSTIVNSISWGNSAPDSPEIYGFATVTYSDVQGGYVGDGNMDINPLFVDPGQWHDNETPGDPSDDYWVEGNYHLQPFSLCIDKGNNDAPNLPDTDFEGDPRVMDGDSDGFARVDMGADEFGDFCEGDFYGDGDVDGSDLSVFAAGGTGITLEGFAANFGRTDCAH